MRSLMDWNLGRLSLKKLQSFLAVAECKSFRKASEILNRSQPAISTQVEALEKDLGVTLFHRSTRRVQLSVEGIKFQAHVRRALEALQEGVDEINLVKGRPKKRIRLSCSPTISGHLLPPILNQFQRSHPEVAVELRESVGNSRQNDLRDWYADLCVGPAFSGGAEFTNELIMQDEISVVLPSVYPVKGRKSIPLYEIAELPLLHSSEGTALRFTVEQAYASIGISPKYYLEAMRINTLVGMVQAGLGVTFLPRFVAEKFHGKDCFVSSVRDPMLMRDISIISRQDYSPPPFVEAFMNILKDRIPIEARNILAREAGGGLSGLADF